MGTGQTLITIGSLVLLSMALLNLNRNLAQSDISLAQNRYRLEAMSLMTTYIQQGSQFFFDEVSLDTNSVKALADFTAPGALGFEGNDTSRIDDFDDFHEHTILDTAESGVIYSLHFHVDYVTLSGDSVVTSGARQYHKRMQIFLTDNYADPLIYRETASGKVKDTLKVSFVQSYWFYN